LGRRNSNGNSIMDIKEKKQKKERRHRRVRAKIKGTAERPRLCVFRSHRHIYVQLIDDEKGETLLSLSDFKLKTPTAKAVSEISDQGQKTEEIKRKQEKLAGAKTIKAFQLGFLAAAEALKKGIKSVVFDKSGYKYHGRVKAVAEGARKGGLKL